MTISEDMATVRDQIWELLDSGLSYGEAAEQLGLSTERCYSWANSGGQRRHKHLTKEERAEILRRIQAGDTTAAITREFQCSGKTLQRIRRAAGIPALRGAKTRRVAPDKEGVAVQLRSEGLTDAQIARQLGTSVRVLQVLFETLDPNYRSDPWFNSWGYEEVTISRAHPYFAMGRRVRDSNRAIVPVHRLVMAEFLGRPLLPTETVHHKNGIRDDNRLENLQLRQGPHGRGAVFTCRSCGSHDIQAIPLTSAEDLEEAG